MKFRTAVMGLLLLCAVVGFAQTNKAIPLSAKVIPLSSERHHHLKLHNDYVNVYRVEVPPRQSVMLHRHDYDAISVMLSDSQVTVRAPETADAPAKLSSGQIRLQPKGYVHLTYIDDTAPYKNVTVELLHTQTNERNICAQVIPRKELHCTDAPTFPGAKSVEQIQFTSDQSGVTLTRLHAHQDAQLAASAGQMLVIVLDDAVVSRGSGGGAEKRLHPGDFVWIGDEKTGNTLKNTGDKDIRFVSFSLQ